MEAKSCSFGKWQRKQIQRASEMISEKSSSFYGLGINKGADNWTEAVSEAKLEAEAALAENIHVYVNTMNRFVVEQIKSNKNSEKNQKLTEFILSISEVNLREIEYQVKDRFFCDSKYYVAILATKNRSEYFKDHVILIPTSVNSLLDQLFIEANEEYIKEQKNKYKK